MNNTRMDELWKRYQALDPSLGGHVFASLFGRIEALRDKPISREELINLVDRAIKYVEDMINEENPTQ
jgi:hypothetical protein